MTDTPDAAEVRDDLREELRIQGRLKHFIFVTQRQVTILLDALDAADVRHAADQAEIARLREELQESENARDDERHYTCEDY